MNYKPILIVLSTFIMGLVVGLLLAGVFIRKQLEPVRDLQTAKGIKKMVSNILSDDTTNRVAIFETVNENITEMQALDLAYRSEMQIYMDTLASDLQPLLNESQYYALLSRIAENRQTIEKRFDKNKRLQELEDKIAGLQQQLEEQLQAPPENTPNSTKPSNSSNQNSGNPPIISNPSSSQSIADGNTTSNPTQIVNREFLRDILNGYYGGNPRLINAFFLMKFEGDTSKFEGFVKKNFQGDTQQLRTVLDRQFGNKKRFRNFHNRMKKRRNPQMQNRPFRNENSDLTPPTNVHPSNRPPQDPTTPTNKEQTLDNDANNIDNLELNKPPINEETTNENTHRPAIENFKGTSNTSLTFMQQRAMNRLLENRFEGDTLKMQQFIINTFEGDTSLFLQEAKKRFEQRRNNRRFNNRQK